MPADSMLNKVASSRWFAVGLLAATAVLLAVVVLSLRERSSPLPPLSQFSDPVEQTVPVNKIEQLSANITRVPIQPFVNGRHPFFTLHFQPPPAPPAPVPEIIPEPVVPAEPPPPPAPEMKKVTLLYQGVYQTADGRNQAFVQLENKLSVLPVGADVIADWAIAEITRQKLTLTNHSALTNILEFNRAKELEIPVK